MIRQWILPLCLFVLHIPFSAAKSCTIRVPEDIPHDGEPIYLNPDESGFRITGKVTKIESLSVFCPGRTIESVPCQRDGHSLLVAQKKCKGRILSELLDTREKCGKSGTLIEIGFQLPSKHFYSIYSSCFDRKSLSPLYTHHVLNGKGVKYRVKQPRKTFREGKGVYIGVNMDELYKGQLERFRKLFGAKQQFVLSSKTSQLFLSRGHLSPEADFTFGTEQHASEMYVNTAPQFQSFNAGNWLRVESRVRALANALQDDLHVFTGVLDVLQLANRKVFLGNGVVPVPALFWKAVFHVKTSAAIVFVGANNPHAENGAPSVCKDVCTEAGFAENSFSNSTLGITICCALKNIVKQSKVVLPRDIEGRKMQHFTKLLTSAEGRNGN
uniref:40 kDa salivary protein SP11 n=1 Tax=Phlebotomus argentipes TaxID=94469 RepID=Q0ZST9_PHLAR|nr:40 kDa salivary protein SP11 [Phlebotomus argentipes]